MPRKARSVTAAAARRPPRLRRGAASARRVKHALRMRLCFTAAPSGNGKDQPVDRSGRRLAVLIEMQGVGHTLQAPPRSRTLPPSAAGRASGRQALAASAR